MPVADRVAQQQRFQQNAGFLHLPGRVVGRFGHFVTLPPFAQHALRGKDLQRLAHGNAADIQLFGQADLDNPLARLDRAFGNRLCDHVGDGIGQRHFLERAYPAQGRAFATFLHQAPSSCMTWPSWFQEEPVRLQLPKVDT